MAIDKSLLFDNKFYYELYPDVYEAVINGQFRNGWDHYASNGKREGREAKYIDELYYRIDNVNEGWSNHLTLKGYIPPEKPEIYADMIEVPESFQQVQSVEYPTGNKIPFERYFTNKFIELKPDTFRTYLSIHWTACYVNNGYGKDKGELQTFLNSLDKSKKYFTIIQYDDGILEDVSGLDLLVYSMGCKRPGYYPLPLISQPINNNPQVLVEKDISMSFYGANTHHVRVLLFNSIYSEYIKLESKPIEQYYDILKRSVFALCPRGYGITSFRLFEAMAFNCIPVYISDDFHEPFNLPFTEYGIKILPNQIKDIPDILSNVDVTAMQAKVKHYYENYFVYSRCANSIIKTLTT